VGGAGLVARGEGWIAESGFETGGIVESAKVFKRGDAGFAVGVVGGRLALVDPVDKAPPGELAQQANSDSGCG